MNPNKILKKLIGVISQELGLKQKMVVEEDKVLSNKKEEAKNEK